MATLQKRDRILYASQSVRANGQLLHRVQTLGSNSTFNSEDIFELGTLQRVDVVDDVPAVAVALDTTEWGAVDTMAILGGLDPTRMKGNPTSSGAYLQTDASCTGSGVRYYHGVSLADFTLGRGTRIWAPVQNEASFGTADDDIQMTLYMDKVYINSITLTYNVSANATEVYAAETDNKRWLVNGARFITQEEWEIPTPTNSNLLNVGLASGNTIPELSDCRFGFLSLTDAGRTGVEVRFSTDRSGTIYDVEATAGTNIFGFNTATNILTLPTNAAAIWTQPIKVIGVYAASAYGNSGDNHGAGMNSTTCYSHYFQAASEADYPAQVGAVRQGHLEIFLIDPDNLPANNAWDLTLRMRTCTITATPTRTAAFEIGHLRPYARTMNFPVTITANTASIAADMEMFARISGFDPADYAEGASATDMALEHLMSKINLILVVKVFQQTDTEAGGTGWDRKVMMDKMMGDNYYDWDGEGTYSHVDTCVNPDRERPLKTVILPNLKITAENYHLAIAGGGGRGGGGGDATQEFNFRASNLLYVVKGDVHIHDVACLQRNVSAIQW